MKLDQHLQPLLDARREQQRYRRRLVAESPQAALIRVGGRELVNFCSNDYLGLASHPELIASMKNAADRFGVGSGASHLVNGHSLEHHALEEELATFTGRERALLFSTGYMANMGVINGLVGKGDLVLEDKLNHASLLDGALLSAAELQRYKHNDMLHLEQRLLKRCHKHCLIATDGVFSMDGDVANLGAMVRLSSENDSWLMVDDAHGFGCLGEKGAGTLDVFGLNQHQVPILIGTLGKAFGTFGAFVAGSEILIESLIQFSRTYIYTTALPPAVAAASRTSLKLVIDAEQQRTHLGQLVARFRDACRSSGLELMDSNTPIQPVLVGSDERAMQMSRRLSELGFWVSAIRPPTVPEGTARLRVTLTAQHTMQQVDQLVEALISAKTGKGE